MPRTAPSWLDAERTRSYPAGMHTRPSDTPSNENQPLEGMHVLTAVAEALAKKGAPAGYRVVYRTNPKGEHVVAVIWPPQTP